MCRQRQLQAEGRQESEWTVIGEEFGGSGGREERIPWEAWEGESETLAVCYK